MQSEVIGPVVEALLKDCQKALPKVPDNLKARYGREGGLAGGAALGVAGGMAGVHLGIAGFFGAITGLLPVAIAAAVIGYLGGSKLGATLLKGHASDSDDPCAEEQA